MARAAEADHKRHGEEIEAYDRAIGELVAERDEARAEVERLRERAETALRDLDEHRRDASAAAYRAKAERLRADLAEERARNAELVAEMQRTRQAEDDRLADGGDA